MEYYETAVMPIAEINKFTTLFDKKVGTDREVSLTGPFAGFVLCMELTHSEVNKCRQLEAQVRQTEIPRPKVDMLLDLQKHRDAEAIGFVDSFDIETED